MALSNSSGPVRRVKSGLPKLAPPFIYDPSNGTTPLTSGTLQYTSTGQVLNINSSSKTVSNKTFTNTTSDPLTVKFTTDGSNPIDSNTAQTFNTSTRVFSGCNMTALSSIFGGGTGIIKAYQYKSKYADSDVSILNIRIPKVSTPIITVESVPNGAKNVRMNSATPNATIRWNYNGDSNITTATNTTFPQNSIQLPSFVIQGVAGTVSIPACNNTVLKNGTNPITYIIAAKAFLTNYFDSDVAYATITLKTADPTITATLNGPFNTSIKFYSGTEYLQAVTYYYTTDGTTPTRSSQSTTSTITVNKIESFTIKVLATSCGFNDSEIISQDIVPIRPTAPSPTINVYLTALNADNVLSNWQDQLAITAPNVVCIDSPSISDYDIRYTIDGNDPTINSSIYDGNCFKPFNQSTPNKSTVTIKAYTKRKIKTSSDNLWYDSPIASKTLTIYTCQVAAPVFRPLTANFDYRTATSTFTPGTFILSSAPTGVTYTKDTVIYYSIVDWDGSVPPYQPFINNSSLKVNGTTRILGYAQNATCAKSELTDFTITITYLKLPKPIISASGGSLKISGIDKVTISKPSGYSNCNLYYSYDGSNWSPYIGPITLTESCTIYAYATQDNYLDSDVTSQAYTVKQPFQGVRYVQFFPNGGNSEYPVTGNWICPDDVSKVIVIITGGGGAGPRRYLSTDTTPTYYAPAATCLGEVGLYWSDTDWWGGGGSGAISWELKTVNSGQSYAYNTGANGSDTNIPLGSKPNGTAGTILGMSAGCGTAGGVKTFGSGGTASGANKYSGKSAYDKTASSYLRPTQDSKAEVDYKAYVDANYPDVRSHYYLIDWVPCITVIYVE